MFRKGLSILLSAVILFACLTVLPLSTTAAEVDVEEVGANIDLAGVGTSITQSEAVAWITARKNEHWAENYDGSSYTLPQCVDLIVYYMNYLGITPFNGYGNGYDYVGRSNLPSGWYYTSSPSAGDIAVWAAGKGIAGGNGHVALVESVYSNHTFDYVDVNGVTGKAGSGNISNSNPSSFIHPNFAGGDPDTHYGAENVNFDGANVSSVSFFDATIGSWMRNPNSYNIRAYGFYLGNNQNDLVQYTIGQNVKWTDSYINANLSKYVGRLSQGVQYYYRFFSLTDGYNLSPIYSFTTSGNSTVTFDHVASSNINNDNMTIECWARNHQGLNISKYGLYFGTALNEMNECIEVGNNISWTDFYISIKMIDQNIELKPNTTYYYQFFALTDGWNYSPVSSFTTGNYIPNNPITPTEPSTIILGDVDGDGFVTIIDVTMIQRKLVQLPVYSFNEKAADIDGDGLDITDATRIQRYLAEFDDPYHIGEVITE